MPRSRKTLSGERAQPAIPVAGQQYGKGVEQQRLEEAMPSPQVQSPNPGIAPPTQSPGVPPSPQAGSLTAPALSPRVATDPMQAATQMAGRAGLLNAPTARPNEPVTAGLRSGAGAGPEALGIPVAMSPIGHTLRQLSNALGDPFFAELANKARV